MDDDDLLRARIMLAFIDLWLLSIAVLLHLIDVAPEVDGHD